MIIHIEHLQVDAIIGILPAERQHPQRILVDADIHYNFDSEQFIDYALICNHISSMLQTNKYGLLEEALEAISASLIAQYTHIKQLTLKIIKPDILPNATVSVELTRIFKEN